MNKIENVMTRSLRIISQDAAISEAAQQMLLKKVGSLLVEHGGNYVGIVTDTDIVRKAVARKLDLNKEKVSLIMSRPLITIDQSRAPQDAFDLMGEAAVRHLVVTDSGKVVGVISVRDLLLYFKKQSEPRIGVD